MPTTRDSHFWTKMRGLLEQEKRAQHARFQEQARDLSLEERAARGFALLDIESVEEEYGLGGRVVLSFARADRKPLETRVGVGDIVALRPRRAEVPHPARGVVSRATRDRISIAFDDPPPPFVNEGRLVAELTPNDVTFEIASRALSAWENPSDSPRRALQKVLLGQEAPRSGPLPAVTPQRPLNPEQQEALQRALAAERFFLVHGPPGTGKSTVLAEVAVQEAARGAKLLVLSASNAAVDHMLDLCLGRGLRAVRLGHPARVSPHLVDHTLDVLTARHPENKYIREMFDEAFSLFGYARRQRSQGRSHARFDNAREARAEAKSLLDDARKRERVVVRSLLDSAQVICATCTGAGAFLRGGSLLEGQSFDVALFDEATQAIEPLSLIAFLHAPKVVFAGDHKQLPPTVISQEAAAQGLSLSLFERLLADHGASVSLTLKEQHRMHAAIMDFPSRETYGGQLRAHPDAAARDLSSILQETLDAPPFLFLDTAGKGFDEEHPPGSESIANPGEADLLLTRAQALLSAGLPPEELALIAPYSAQVSLLRHLAQARGLPDAVEIDTVDSFQGREKDAVLVSLTRANTDGQLGFLTDLRRINVAITRARRHLFVVGDSATLGAHPFYQRWLDHAQSSNAYRSAWDF